MTSHDKVNVLLVDDQRAKLLPYDGILGELGDKLLKAASAREAFEHLLKNDVAIVLIDVCMPDLDGFQLAAMIREHPRFQRTAIIFISAIHLTDIDRLKGYERGAVDYISVPVIPELLRAKVRVISELHRAHRQLEHMNRELEQRVKERTQQLQQSADLLELASEAIIVRDWDGRVVFWSAGAESVYGWKREEVLGRDLHEVLKTNYPTSQKEVISALTNSGKWSGNLVQVAKDGDEIT